MSRVLTLADLRYLRRVVRRDYWRFQEGQIADAMEAKLTAMIAQQKGGDRSMAVAKKTSKAAPKKPSKPVGKKVVKKK